MNKEKFIYDLKQISKIKSYETKISAVRTYLLTQKINSDIAFTTNEYAESTYQFIIENYSSYKLKENVSVNFRKVLGGKHCDYIKRNPLLMIMNGAKRTNINFDNLSSNPEYYFGVPCNDTDIMCFAAFKPRGEDDYVYITTEGNHRNATALYIQSLFYNEDITVRNCGVVYYDVDWELIDKIESKNKKFSIFNLEVSIEKEKYSDTSNYYNLIKYLHLKDIKNNKTIEKIEYQYSEENIVINVLNNEKHIHKTLDELMQKISFNNKLIAFFKLVRRESKKIF